MDNLALAFGYCNAKKGPNIGGIDPATGQITPLYHARRDVWEDHFEWVGAQWVGRTAAGRATVSVLDINHAAQLDLRESIILEDPLTFG